MNIDVVQKVEVNSNSGYTLVGLIIAISVLLIGMMVAIPLWSTAIKREKEKELIFRGEQYAMAIQEYKMKTGKDLTDLESLIKVKPRVIRKLWTDPMTGENDWRLIHHGELMAQARQGIPGLTDNTSNESEKGQSGLTTPPNIGGPGGPIIGVASKSNETSIMTYKDKNKYSEWLFTVNDLNQKRAMILGGGQPGGAAPPQSGDPSQRKGPVDESGGISTMDK